MAYTKTTWVNDQTELNAENLNHIEDGIANSQNVELIAISDEAPSECATGDKYYNTDDNKIYTATGTNTWSEDGEEPIRDVFYILFSEQSSYSYDGTTLVSVGGGTEDIVISDEEPTEEGVKIWIDTGEDGDSFTEITNEYSTSTGKGYSANYSNEHFGGVELYNSTTGSNTSVTLSDSVDNYEYIEIYFGNQAKTRNSSIKLMKGSYNTQLKLINISNTSTQQNTQEYYKDINVSGTSITTNLNRALYITSAIGEYSTATITSSNDNLVYIYRVVGYK